MHLVDVLVLQVMGEATQEHTFFSFVCGLRDLAGVEPFLVELEPPIDRSFAAVSTEHRLTICIQFVLELQIQVFRLLESQV